MSEVFIKEPSGKWVSYDDNTSELTFQRWISDGESDAESESMSEEESDYNPDIDSDYEQEVSSRKLKFAGYIIFSRYLKAPGITRVSMSNSPNNIPPDCEHAFPPIKVSDKKKVRRGVWNKLKEYRVGSKANTNMFRGEPRELALVVVKANLF